MSEPLYGNINGDEAVARLPEVEDIRDDTLREQTIQVIREFPDYFWTAPASNSHHPPEHQTRHGLWLHTKRVCTAFERLAPSMVQQGFMEWQDVDYGRAACLLHDMFKFGVPPTDAGSVTSDHDVAAADWLREHTDLPSEVIGAVEAHNGAWYEGRRPQTHLEQMVHIADMMASDENVSIAIEEPHPALEDQFPRVSER